MPHKINLADKLSQFEGHWQPRVVGAFNGHDLMVVKLQGQFPWHKHDDTDDFFMVLKGEVTIRLRDGDVTLQPDSRSAVSPGRSGVLSDPTSKTSPRGRRAASPTSTPFAILSGVATTIRS